MPENVNDHFKNLPGDNKPTDKNDILNYDN